MTQIEIKWISTTYRAFWGYVNSITFSAVSRFEWQTRVAKQWNSSVKKFSCVVNPWANDVASPINAGSCWPKMLRPFSRGFSLDSFMSKAPCKRTKHCWPTTPNIDGSCCIRLHGFKLCSTTCNKVWKRTQYVTPNNIGSCWPTMLRSFDGRNKSQHCWESLRLCEQYIGQLFLSTWKDI